MSNRDPNPSTEQAAAAQAENAQEIDRLKADALRAFNLKKMAQLDFYRSVAPLAQKGLTFNEIARFLRTSPSVVSSAVKASEKQEPLMDGQIAASVTEVIQRHAAGMIDEDTMMDILVNWPYTPDNMELMLSPDGQPSENTP